LRKSQILLGTKQLDFVLDGVLASTFSCNSS